MAPPLELPGRLPLELLELLSAPPLGLLGRLLARLSASPSFVLLLPSVLLPRLLATPRALAQSPVLSLAAQLLDGECASLPAYPGASTSDRLSLSVYEPRAI